MTKGERVDASSTWEISVLDKKQEKENELPYNVLESVSKEDNKDGKRERGIDS